jgi:hypothetical protein
MKTPATVFISAFAMLTLLSACSGGGGGSTSTPTSTTTTSPTISLANWNANNVNNGSITTYTISGSYGTIVLSGSGTLTVGTPVSANINGVALLKTTGVTNQTLTQTPTVGSPVTNVSSDTTYSYVTSSYVPAYYDGGTYFDAIDANFKLPASIKANDAGSFGTSTEYSNSSMVTITGADTYSYSVVADSATSVLFSTYDDFYNASNVKQYRSTNVTRINTDGTSKRISNSYIDFPSTGTQLILNRTFQ